VGVKEMQMADKKQQMMTRCQLCDSKGGDKRVRKGQSVTNAW